MSASRSGKTATGGPTATFFEELGRRGHEPLLRKVGGRVRFDVVEGAHTDSWLVAVEKGDVSVALVEGEADCVIGGERVVFDEVVAGRANALAAVLRGALACRGDLELLFAIQRIFPDPPRGWDPTAGTRTVS